MAEDIDVRRLRLQPGDSVVVTVPRSAFDQPLEGRSGAQVISEAMRSHLDRAGHDAIPVLIVSDDVGISVLSGAECHSATN